jgi:hypothetical protein
MFKERLRMRLESMPAIYLGLLRINRTGTRWQKLIVSKDTDIVVEGYPRSANSFARAAFLRMQPNWESIRIATHTHSPAQIVLAAKLGVPTMVLLRDPMGAMRGFLAYGLQQGTLKQITQQDVERVADRYIWFYESIAPVRDKIFIARFDEVIKDYAAVSARFIAKYGKTWRAYDPVELPQEKIFEKKSHIGPSADRDRIKAEVEQKLEEWLDPERKRRAQAIYDKLGTD